RRGNAIIGGDLLATYPSNALVVGPVEKVSVATGQVTILGQTFQGPAGSRQLQSMSEQLASGTPVLATITGAPDKSGHLHPISMTANSGPYAAGASRVLVVGRVSSTSLATGHFSVGQLVVDYTSLLADSSVQVASGSTVAIVGVQAAKGGALQALQLRVLR
ncbi:MAG TPA: hypothetical protein PL152_01600, partial [Steroidobacteraceae bacterium]|nr:hypothetical protein [Steroidobacteraceae bacterium]